MQDKQILIAGCGKIGLRVAQQLADQYQVWGLKRNLPSNVSNVGFIQADLADKNTLNTNLEQQCSQGFDFIIYCLSPGERTEAAYRCIYVDGLKNLLDATPNPQRLKRVYFVSSTSVYHQNDQSWVNENSPSQPLGFSGKILLEAETLLKNFKVPSTIIRFSGIYGGNRSRLIEQVKKQESALSNQARITNRIHEDDCVGFLTYLIQQQINGVNNQDLYLATDSEPIDLNDVISWLAQQLNVDISVQKTLVQNRRSGNKFCSNKRMLESGYRLKYPSFREGYLLD